MAYPNPPRTWTDAEFVNAALINAQLRDALNEIGQHKRIRKTAEESDTTGTLQNDDHLFFSIGASEVWSVTLELAIFVAAAADFKYAWTLPAGATGHWWDLGNVSGLSSHGHTPIATQLVHGTASDTEGNIQTQATIVNSTTPGTAQLQFAANAGGATATIHANSVLIAHRIA